MAESIIKKPMLAQNLPIDTPVNFPVAATPKIDGIRAVMINGKLVSRTLKPIPNKYIREILESVLPDGADGEILYGKNFQDSTSAVMTSKGNTDLADVFSFYWFDYLKESADKPYVDRTKDIEIYIKKNKQVVTSVSDKACIIPLYPVIIDNQKHLDKYEKECLEQGYEGLIVRNPDGRYKFGRSTLKEGLMLKLKRFQDAEATVIGYEELRHNMNEAVEDALGHKKRSSHKDNKQAGGVLGSLIVETSDKIQFKIGTGFNAAQRKLLWESRKKIIGKTVKYKFLEIGVKDAPRHPVFMGFRDTMDM
jgi:DNA ligase-1